MPALPPPRGIRRSSLAPPGAPRAAAAARYRPSARATPQGPRTRPAAGTTTAPRAAAAARYRPSARATPQGPRP